MPDTKTTRPRLGIGSFAYRYAIGTDAFRPPAPMTVTGFLRAASTLGYEGVQLCENLKFSGFDESDFDLIREEADRLGLFLEVGMRGLTQSNLEKHLRIATLLRSKFLRIVIGDKSPHPSTDPESLVSRTVVLLGAAMRYCEDNDLSIGLENHFDLPNSRLLEIVERVDNPRLGLVFDTTNSIGFIEKPQETLERMGPRLLSVHIKDFRCEKEDTGYRTTGVPLGEGWLDVRAILESILFWNSGTSILLELSIREKEEASVQSTLDMEKDAIMKSTRYLKDVLSDMTRLRKGDCR